MPGEDANDEVLEDVDLSDNHHLLLSFQMGDASVSNPLSAKADLEITCQVLRESVLARLALTKTLNLAVFVR